MGEVTDLYIPKLSKIKVLMYNVRDLVKKCRTIRPRGLFSIPSPESRRERRRRSLTTRFLRLSLPPSSHPSHLPHLPVGGFLGSKSVPVLETYGHGTTGHVGLPVTSLCVVPWDPSLRPRKSPLSSGVSVSNKGPLGEDSPDGKRGRSGPRDCSPNDISLNNLYSHF